ncbi:biotin--[acetyl-CoA-carboxylase] ligase [Candidatus Omnitrophota bacterium]
MMEERILKLFKKQESSFISGEDISSLLKISRSAVWKHVEKLRSQGYEFDAVPHLGYRLLKTPDRLFPHEISSLLKAKILGNNISYHETIDSTNKAAFDLASKGVKEGMVVIAERQAKGKGRLSREWVSPKYAGIYMSVILRPKVLPFDAPKLTLLAAVSTATAIKAITGSQLLIKWPNDILLNKKKVGGILTEMDAESDSVNFIILGIGINVNTKLTDLPKGASSIYEETQIKHSRVELTSSILESLEAYYLLFQKEGFAQIRREWKNMSATIGRQVRAKCMRHTIEGEAVDLEPDGALKIRLDNGFHEKVIAGDLTLLR